MPAAPLELGLSLGLQSAADSGDDIISPAFSVDFGDKMSKPTESPLGPLIREGITAIAVALAAKWIWSKIK